MVDRLTYDKVPKNALFIDVRSPAEYEDACIEGAINVPILDNEERAIVGTLYKQSSTDEAKQRGVEIVSKKLPEMFKRIIDIKKTYKRPLVFYCARGGYRSTAFASFLNGLGEKVFVLHDGYKGYRAFIRSEIDRYAKIKNFVVLHGNTGMGKTRILQALRKRGIDVLDFEEGANHRGSILGSVGLGKSVGLKSFESYIYHRLAEFDTDYIVVEAESKRIGKVFIPDSIHNKMGEGIHVNLSADYNFRAEILTEDYTSHKDFEKDMADGIQKLGKYIGKTRVEKYTKMLYDGEIRELAIELMKNYYDPLYEHKANTIDYELEYHIKTLDNAVDDIYNWYMDRFVEIKVEEERENDS